MKIKQTVKIIVDIAMTVILLLLMSYSLVGESAHEWLGIIMLFLFVSHHILNSNWSKTLFKGRYTALRIFRNAVTVLVLLCMIGSAVSGIMLSRYVFDLDIRKMSSVMGTLHMICAYWGMLLMSVHIGTHLNMIISMIRKFFGKSSKISGLLFRSLAVLAAAYGVYAFFRRDIGNYMFLRYHFVYFDTGEPLIFFLSDYTAVMWLFAYLTYVLTEKLRSCN